MKTAELTQINPIEVGAYLKGTGWEVTTSRRPQINLFNIKHNGVTHEITLPLSREFKDYTNAMYSVVKRIAEVEDRQFDEVISRLITPIADIIKFRRADQITSNGTIPFNEGIRLFENSRKALYAVVCDLIEPKLYHKKLSLKAADAFIDRCSYGQTERGSYIATIICPFSQADIAGTNQLPLFGSTPDFENAFTRQVTARLMKSLNIVHQAIETNQIDSLQKLDLDRPSDIISGNLLEALVDLNGSTTSAQIEISTQWAPLVPMTREQIPTSIQFNREDFEPLERMVERIQEEQETTTQQGVFIGRISLIQAEPNIQERKNGEVILNTLDNEGKLIKPRMVVSPDELELALKAMSNGLNVRVRGILSTRKRSKILEYTSLEVID